MDTYDRRTQLGASRRRREDAEMLHGMDRWAGAMYLGGYAIECSLKSLLCYRESKNNLKDTRAFTGGAAGINSHNLVTLLNHSPDVRRAIVTDRTGTYKQAWNTVVKIWQKDMLRYGDKQGDQQDSQKFVDAVKTLHLFILSQQGESS